MDRSQSEKRGEVGPVPSRGVPSLSQEEFERRRIPHPTVRVQPLVHVDPVGEGVAQSHGGEEHLDADDEVLVAGGDRSLPHGEVGGVDLRDGAAFLQDGQQHACVENKEAKEKV